MLHELHAARWLGHSALAAVCLRALGGNQRRAEEEREEQAEERGGRRSTRVRLLRRASSSPCRCESCLQTNNTEISSRSGMEELTRFLLGYSLSTDSSQRYHTGSVENGLADFGMTAGAYGLSCRPLCHSTDTIDSIATDRR